MLRTDRASRGGGVALLVKKSLRHEVLPSIDTHESVWCKLFFHHFALVIGVIYRPPGSLIKFFEDIDNHLAQITKDRSKVILVGDFNLPGVNWDARIPGPLDRPHAELMLEMMVKYSLVQVVEKPTRIQGNSSALLDLLFISESTFEHSIEVNDGISDHKMVVATLKINKPLAKKRIVHVYNFNRADDTSVLDYLELALDRMPNDNDVDKLWNYFTDVVHSSLSRFVPKRAKRIHKDNPWVSREIIHLKRQLRRARQRKPKNSERIAILSTQVRQALRASKTRFFTTTLTEYLKTSPQKFWRYLARSKPSINGVVVNNAVCNNPPEIAQEFNNFFASVFSEKDESTAVDLEFQNHSDASTFFSKEGIVDMLLKLDVKKSPGPDKIPNEYLRRYCEWTACFLVKIFSVSLIRGALPNQWLLARIVPVFKAGERLHIGNYRPISITCTACKIMEHIICKQLVEYIENNNIFYSKQHGFRRRLSTVTQLFETIHSFAEALNCREQVDVIALDLSKAFDRVSHTKLIEKLYGYNINLQIIKWIQAYLRNRQQFVEIDGECSSLLPVSSGVPQGSVLGPILFLLYINDIATDVHPDVEVRLFADDCLLFCRVKSTSDQNRLNDSLCQIYNWCEKWNMQINFDKSVCMTVTNKKSPLMFSYAVNNNVIKRSTKLKYLGVTISSNLNWNEHVENICGSAQRRLGLLRRKLRDAAPDIKLKAYTTFVRPNLEYASIIWDPHQQYIIDRLERIQRMAVRFIFSDYDKTHSVTTMIGRAGLTTLAVRRKIARLKFLYQLYNNKLNLSPSLYLKAPGRVSPRTNHAYAIMPYVPRVDVFKHSFIVKTIVEWNNLNPCVFPINNTVDDFVKNLNALFV